MGLLGIAGGWQAGWQTDRGCYGRQVSALEYMRGPMHTKQTEKRGVGVRTTRWCDADGCSRGSGAGCSGGGRGGTLSTRGAVSSRSTVGAGAAAGAMV